MKTDMMAHCGTYCETCDWREKTNCKGCKQHEGKMFWGSCAIALCSMEKGFSHCGECEQLPCEVLQEAYDHPEHGDNGERLTNLKKWAKGEDSFLKARTL